MEIKLEPFLTQYEALSKAIDGIFEKVKAEYPDCVRCKPACTDCCYALFDISLIEALYISRRFNESVEEGKKADILERANLADRKIHKIKRQAFKDFESGKHEDDILVEMAEKQARCPLLNLQETCDMYSDRPITCRLYGIPTEIGGTGRTCGKSGFKPGASYPTVHLNIIHQKLFDLSNQFAISIKSRYGKLAELLVPLSMALLTDYNAEYLGIINNTEDDGEGA